MVRLSRLVLEIGDLAVPVGGSRKSGFVVVSGRKEGRAAVRQLEAFPTLLPNLRFVPGGQDCAANVHWREPIPWSFEDSTTLQELATQDRTAGELYGCGAAEIESYVLEHYRPGF